MYKGVPMISGDDLSVPKTAPTALAWITKNTDDDK